MNKVKFGVFISNLRVKKNLTQEKVAEALEVTHQTVSKWERGITLPELNMLVKIANYYDVSLYELTSCKIIKSPLISKFNKQKMIDQSSYNKTVFFKSLIFLIGILILFIMFFSLIYSIENYNKFKFYQLISENDNFDINGFLVKENDNFYLTINNINYLINEENNSNYKTKKIKCNLYNDTLNIQNEITVDEYLELHKIVKLINFNVSDISTNEEFSHFYIKLNYRNEIQNEKSEVFKIQLLKKYSNDKIFY